MSHDLRATLRDLMPALRSDLEDLVRIQSVSADPARSDEVWRSADAVAWTSHELASSSLPACAVITAA